MAEVAAALEDMTMAELDAPPTAALEAPVAPEAAETEPEAPVAPAAPAAEVAVALIHELEEPC